MLLSSFSLCVSAADTFDERINPEYYVQPVFAGYYLRNGEIGDRQSFVYDGDSEYGLPAYADFNVDSTNVDNVPVTYFIAFDIDPDIVSGYNYGFTINFQFKSLAGTFERPDDVIKLNMLYFANQTGLKPYVIPADNIVSNYTAYYSPANSSDVAKVVYRCNFYINVDQKVDTNQLNNGSRKLFIEIPAYMVNSTRIESYVSKSDSYVTLNKDNFDNFVANRIADMDRVNKEMSQNIRTGFANMQSAIDDMPLSEYDFANGRFGRDAQNGADELLGSWTDKFSGIIATAQSSMTSLYNAISTHEADFCIIMPDSKVPIFEDLKIYEKSGLIRLENMLPDGVYEKFEDVLPVVRGVISVAAVFGLLWWCIPKHLLGGDKD